MTNNEKIDLAAFEAELKAFIERLPESKKSIEDSLSLSEVIDTAISSCEGAVDEKRKRKLNLEEELIVATIGGHLARLKREQRELLTACFQTALENVNNVISGLENGPR